MAVGASRCGSGGRIGICEKEEAVGARRPWRICLPWSVSDARKYRIHLSGGRSSKRRTVSFQPAVDSLSLIEYIPTSLRS